jgi:hypothetical protein
MADVRGYALLLATTWLRASRRSRRSAVSLATILRDSPGFTGATSACGSNRKHTKGKTMTVVQATRTKASSGATRSGQLFLLPRGGRITHHRRAGSGASPCRIKNIDPNDVMILPHHANLRRMEFSETTPLDYELFFTHPCALISALIHSEAVASSGLPDSCPRDGDVPKSPFTYRQRRCYRLTHF